ncbi:MAG: HAD-IIIC family phosphatase [Cyanobacteria bacterium]|nr:HAD-IIIC family phosphatase [Cyanobacteriota bacterium]
MVALAATFTADPVKRTVRYLLDLLRIPHQLSIVGYNQVQRELIDPGSCFAQNRGGINVALLRLADLCRANTPIKPDPEVVRREAHQLADFAARYAQRETSPPLLVMICPEPSALRADANYAVRAAEIEAALVLELRAAGVEVLTSSEILELYPLHEWNDSVADLLGHVPYTDDAFAAIGAVIARKIRAFVEPPFKVLAIDADNTLWTGAVGEDGPDGIVLDPGRLALQRFVKKQHDGGMLLCLCSKNVVEDIEEVFSRRKMLLGQHHFVVSKVNWQPKSDNLRAAATSLSLNLDSFVFLDDNLLECADVSAHCPEVLTIHLPEDSSEAAALLPQIWAFDRWSSTDEDRRRNELYRQDVERRQVQRDVSTLREFLSLLALEIAIEPPSAADLPRLAQLTHRTNQFNFTTVRRSEAELRSCGLECLKVKSTIASVTTGSLARCYSVRAKLPSQLTLFFSRAGCWAVVSSTPWSRISEGLRSTGRSNRSFSHSRLAPRTYRLNISFARSDCDGSPRALADSLCACQPTMHPGSCSTPMQRPLRRTAQMRTRMLLTDSRLGITPIQEWRVTSQQTVKAANARPRFLELPTAMTRSVCWRPGSEPHQQSVNASIKLERTHHVHQSPPAVWRRVVKWRDGWLKFAERCLMSRQWA